MQNRLVLWLPWQLLWRSAWWGFLRGLQLGTGLGVLLAAFLIRSESSWVNTPVVSVMGMVYGIVTGAWIGFVTGCINGVILTTLHAVLVPRYAYHWYPERVQTMSRSMLSVVCLAYTVVNALPAIDPGRIGFGLVTAWVVGGTSKHIIMWYDQTSAPVSAP